MKYILFLLVMIFSCKPKDVIVKPILTGEHIVLEDTIDYDKIGRVNLIDAVSYSISTSTDSMTVNGITFHNWRHKDSISKINFYIQRFNEELKKTEVDIRREFIRKTDSMYANILKAKK